MYLKYVSVESEFGHDIVLKCIELASGQYLDKIEVLSWDSNDCTRHLVYLRKPGMWRKFLIKIGVIKPLFNSASVSIDHKNGQAQIKGSYDLIIFNRWVFHKKISFNTYEQLADPDSLLRIGRRIVSATIGKNYD